MSQVNRIIITGITSFIGVETARQLARAGHEVWGLVRPQSTQTERIRELEALGISLLRLDLDALVSAQAAMWAAGQEHSGKNSEEAGQLQYVMAEGKSGQEFDGGLFPFSSADVWLHLAWGGSGADYRADEDRQALSVAQAKLAYTLAARLGCRRFVFAGSQAEYGGRHENPSPVSAYGKAKLAFGRWACRQDAIPQYIHLRIFSVYGRGDHAGTLVMTALKTLLQGGDMVLGACTQQWTYIERRDCAAAICLLCIHEAAQGGVYDIAGADTRPLRSFVEELHRLCGGKGRLCFGLRADNAEGNRDLIADLDPLQSLGFREQYSFEQGVRELLAELPRGC